MLNIRIKFEINWLSGHSYIDLQWCAFPSEVCTASAWQKWWRLSYSFFWVECVKLQADVDEKHVMETCHMSVLPSCLVDTSGFFLSTLSNLVVSNQSVKKHQTSQRMFTFPSRKVSKPSQNLFQKLWNIPYFRAHQIHNLVNKISSTFPGTSLPQKNTKQITRIIQVTRSSLSS